MRARALPAVPETRLRKPERILRGAEFPIVAQAVFRLGGRRDVAHRNPPERVGRLCGLLEPLGAAFEELKMMRLVNVASQRLNRFPDGHVDQFERIFGIDNIGCVSGAGLQPPYKAGRGFGQRIDRIEVRLKRRHHGRIHGSENAPCVHLSQMHIPFMFACKWAYQPGSNRLDPAINFSGGLRTRKGPRCLLARR